MRLGVDVTYSPVTSMSPNCVVTFKVYTENKFAYNDTQMLTYGGSAGISGTLNFSNTSTTGQQVLRDTKTWTHTYASNGLGASKTFSATLSGAFNNVAPTVIVTATTPTRGAAPATVTELHLEYVSDTQGIVTWNNPAGPITTNTVMRQEYAMNGAWADITPPFTSASPIETLTSNSLRPNMLFRFQVRANNAVGSGPYATSNLIFTTPAAPSNVVAARQPQGVVLTWMVTHPPTNQGQASTRYVQHIEVSTDGGSTWTSVNSNFVPSVAGSQTYTDHNPPSLAATYRVSTWTPNGLASIPGVAAEIPALPGKIFAGADRALTIYAGSSRAHKIYMGSTQVWP
jgi:hypothetical protein